MNGGGPLTHSQEYGVGPKNNSCLPLGTVPSGSGATGGHRGQGVNCRGEGESPLHEKIRKKMARDSGHSLQSAPGQFPRPCPHSSPGPQERLTNAHPQHLLSVLADLSFYDLQETGLHQGCERGGLWRSPFFLPHFQRHLSSTPGPPLSPSPAGIRSTRQVSSQPTRDSRTHRVPCRAFGETGFLLEQASHSWKPVQIPPGEPAA